MAKTKASATAMSMEWLRERGYIVERTEQTVRAFDKKLNKWKIWKKDLWSFADLTAVKGACGNGVLFVQATIGIQHKQERMDKIVAALATKSLLDAGNQIELHVWRKMGKRLERKTWQLARFILSSDCQWMAETGEKVQGGPLFTTVEDDF